MSIEEAIARRRSVRDFAPGPLSHEEIGQLAWAAQGITDRPGGGRAAPSAGALYPLDLYILKADGVYEYEPTAHSLHRRDSHDVRGNLAHAAHDRAPVRAAPIDLVIVGIVARARVKYGNRAERYVTLEAGHAIENVLLEATALELGAVPIGAFQDDEVRGILALGEDTLPLYIVPVGHVSG
jgi:SagB-type dehydrogenase family enzyme